MTASVEDSAVQTKAIQEISMEEDEHLFEIDLDAVNAIPPPHYWESYYAATGNALLANCLLPISDISVAVPDDSSTEALGDVTEPVSLGGALELLNQKMQAQPPFVIQHH